MKTQKPAQNHQLNQQMRRELPFKTRPKQHAPRIVGNEDVGLIEIPIYGALTVGENLEFLALVKRQDVRDFMTRSQELAKKAAEADEQEGEEDQELGVRLADMDLATVMAEYNVEAATIILKGRVDPEWTSDDTMRLSPVMVAQLAQILQDELNYSSSKRDEDGEASSAEADVDPT